MCARVSPSVCVCLTVPPCDRAVRGEGHPTYGKGVLLWHAHARASAARQELAAADLHCRRVCAADESIAVDNVRLRPLVTRTLVSFQSGACVPRFQGNVINGGCALSPPCTQKSRVPSTACATAVGAGRDVHVLAADRRPRDVQLSCWRLCGH